RSAGWRISGPWPEKDSSCGCPTRRVWLPWRARHRRVRARSRGPPPVSGIPSSLGTRVSSEARGPDQRVGADPHLFEAGAGAVRFGVLALRAQRLFEAEVGPAVVGVLVERGKVDALGVGRPARLDQRGAQPVP